MRYIASLFYFILLGIPLTVLVEKLYYYLNDNPFEEWWITILWILILPFTIIIMSMWKHERIVLKEESDETQEVRSNKTNWDN